MVLKVLSCSLNIQVSFIETTLFTPRRFFERAIEKCYDDFLSSIVESCFWGKHVAVGTGSQFDILWDQNEVRSDQMSGMDVNTWLVVLVKTNSNPACLGRS